MNTFYSNINKRASHIFLILKAIFLICTNNRYFLTIQATQFLIFAYFSDDIFCIISTYFFGIY